MPQVKCSVANCQYWAAGNNCNADQINIEVDEHANMNFNEEFAGENFNSNHQDRASKESNTCCHTFKKKS
ncbi:DUF1540 domain-containing protein [Chengkuizengella marina]|uniref:DUF1540 domain-containing protein n=1 Tax=Chengkuizengella marina TaxID=2507566 RepID=A0A6N9Q3K4_9BACL|nr:DUF1540 domain-containing protein [Chengkuizengella marina]NBI29388.1 DUF1540 domain-containing protein [Chengkuizengella marina]